jgi:tRNA(Ile)-lysidine synthase
MHGLLMQVEETTRQHRLLGAGARILVAVSGGVDSMVLLHVLHELAPRHQWRLTLAHFNHQLRGQASRADEALARRAARRLGWPFVAGRGAIKSQAAAQGLSIEMAARQSRHKFLAGAARRLSIGAVALAHHLDDQTELFFLRLFRGAGCEGLAGMKPLSPSPADPRVRLVRPLLEVDKAALYAFARERGIPFREDASNASLDMPRNRLRRELLPLLRRHYQPALPRVVGRAMNLLRESADCVAAQARAWLRAHVPPSASGAKGAPLCCENGERQPSPQPSPVGRERESGTPRGSFSWMVENDVHADSHRMGEGRGEGPVPTPFEALHPAIQRVVLQIQLHQAGIGTDHDLIAQLLQKPGAPVSVGPERCVRRDREGRVSLLRPPRTSFQHARVELNLEPPHQRANFAGLAVSWQFKRGLILPPRHAGQECFDADKVGAKVILRHWQPGDRFHPIRMPKPVKLQDWFTNRKVPRARRRELVLAATARGEIFWVEGERMAEPFKVTSATRRQLRWRWRRVLVSS